MSRYDLLLCDADETLLDFDRSETAAFTAAMEAFSIPADEETTAAYKLANSACWKAFEQGRMTIPQLRVRRFADFLSAIGSGADPSKVSECYERLLCRQSYTIPGAPEAVRRWMKLVRVIIVTNGISDVQRGRFAGSPFPELAEDMIISEELGVSKPDPEIIRIAMVRAGVTDRSRVLMLGDSLTSDMRAAANAGIEACWYNPKGKEGPAVLPLAYVIADLDEVDAILR